MNNNGHDAPRIEDFDRRRPGELSQWIRDLEPLVPTPIPQELHSRRSLRHTQMKFGTAARAIGIPIRTLKKDGVLWVLRIPDEEVRR